MEAVDPADGEGGATSFAAGLSQMIERRRKTGGELQAVRIVSRPVFRALAVLAIHCGIWNFEKHLNQNCTCSV